MLNDSLRSAAKQLVPPPRETVGRDDNQAGVLISGSFADGPMIVSFENLRRDFEILTAVIVGKFSQSFISLDPLRGFIVLLKKRRHHGLHVNQSQRHIILSGYGSRQRARLA